MSIDPTTKYVTFGSGLTSSILWAAVAVLLIDAPATNDSTSVVSSWFGDNRWLILGACYIQVVCIMTTMIFISGLWAICRKEEGGAGLISQIAQLTGYAIFITAIITFSLIGGAAFMHGSLSDQTIWMLFTLAMYSVNMTGLPTAVSMFCFAYVFIRYRVFHLVFGLLALITGILHLVSAGCVATSGIFSPSGIGLWICPPLYYIWIAAVSIAIFVPALRKRNKPEEQRLIDRSSSLLLQ